jgi:hypothetical protein
MLASNNFARAVSSQIVSRSITSNNQVISTGSSSQVSSGTSESAPVGTTHLIVFKHVPNNNLFSAQDFMITVNSPGATATFPGSEQGTDVIVNPGTISVSETNNRGIVPNTVDGCSGLTLNPGDTQECTISNTISGASAQSEASPIIALQPKGGPTTTTQKVPVSESAPITPNHSDPPFEVCKTSQQVNGTSKVPSSYLIAPSSATYVIEGSTSISKLLRIFNNNNNNLLTFEISAIVGNNPDLSLARSNPPFLGKIVEGTPPLYIKTVPFNIHKVQTFCKFITLIKPIGTGQKNGITPLGEIGQIKENSNPPPTPTLNLLTAINSAVRVPGRLFDLASGDTRIDAGNPNTFLINPPFRVCKNSVDDTADIAKYIISGKPDLHNLNNLRGTHTLAIFMTSDVLITPIDKAQIINNNNPAVKIQLVVDPGTASAQAIDFPINEISTNCVGVGFTDNNNVDPTSSEIITEITN